mgnify:CR=1 FL=1
MRLTFIRECLRIVPVNDVLSSLISIGGWIGAAELLVAYFLVSKGTIAGDSLKYQALNITGSVLLTIKLRELRRLAQRHRQRLLPAGGPQHPVHGEAGLHRPALAPAG